MKERRKKKILNQHLKRMEGDGRQKRKVCGVSAKFLPIRDDSGSIICLMDSAWLLTFFPLLQPQRSFACLFVCLFLYCLSPTIFIFLKWRLKTMLVFFLKEIVAWRSVTKALDWIRAFFAKFRAVRFGRRRIIFLINSSSLCECASSVINQTSVSDKACARAPPTPHPKKK